jgi:hypothetical protein
MPANTSPDNIQFPTAGDQIAPLNTVFQNLAQTTQTALTATRNRLVANVADFTALAALSTTGKLAGDLAFVVEGAVYMSWTGTAWRQTTTATFASTGARDTAYAKAGAAFRVLRVRALDTSTAVESAWNGSAWIRDYQVSTNAITARAGYTLGVDQLIRRDRLTVYLTFNVTKNVGNWNLDEFADISDSTLRPDMTGLILAFGAGQDISGAPRGVAIGANGSLQCLVAGIAGANRLFFSATYVIEPL